MVLENHKGIRHVKTVRHWHLTLRVEIVIHNFDRLPIRVHGITCIQIPLGFDKISFRSESISWDVCTYTATRRVPTARGHDNLQERIYFVKKTKTFGENIEI